ncbi:2-oxoacid:ferredoxin oxidoreductase subunit beta [Telmatospirillum sp.]|uniref:2-oxoacid:ferredoxin oxidoreductase subunit beta n=1 Tax=Telmatospirillum sp. TaxID=2079197 RepID=UPI00283D6DD4|nr:2-oxoacid:ferredoxin oxidoreductase subunit beta [Telmatospirillum sp.]MDR3439215.1 2-oxoacid:ferredoxin oxidoreductase subunit beta [Telmatospirillum sp.]
MNVQVPLTAQDFKSDVKPIWCPGCGDYAVLSAITKALAELDTPREKIAFISGIGCSSRIPAYTNLYGFHGVHGRALPIAAGVKLARPDLTVIVAGGDGDGLSIGGNHFLHACRRNVDMTYVIMDNEVYGMTKGQASPTTSPDWCKSKLTPEGTGISPVEPIRLALAAGANFIARGFAGNPAEVARLIVEGIAHPGFSFIQILSPCVTYRPEEREWKQAVHASETEPAQIMAEAMHRLAADDGFTTGVLFAGNRAPFMPARDVKTTIADIERKFAS